VPVELTRGGRLALGAGSPASSQPTRLRLDCCVARYCLPRCGGPGTYA